MTATLTPFLLRPVYQNYLWGGGAFRLRLRRNLPEGRWAESWEVSGHPDGASVIETGELAGVTLPDAVIRHGAALLGSLAGGASVFPLLIKVLDAAQDLSVQVHPNDASAAAHGGEPKTEMWHLLDAAPGAVVYRGWKPGFNLEGYDQAIATGAGLADQVRPVPMRTGDTVFIPGGLVHAIGAGCLILEVQQTSNTTYRIDDWGRTGPDGKPRELHTRQARDHLRWYADEPDTAVPVALPDGEGFRRERLLRSPYFEMRRLILNSPLTRHPVDDSTFRVWFPMGDAPLVLAWEGARLEVPGWRSVMIPASAPEITVEAAPGAVILETRLPTPAV